KAPEPCGARRPRLHPRDRRPSGVVRREDSAAPRASTRACLEGSRGLESPPRSRRSRIQPGALDPDGAVRVPPPSLRIRLLSSSAAILPWSSMGTVASGPTIHTFAIALSDVDRSVYET